MSVLNDILSFFRDLITGNTEASDNRRTLVDSQVPVVVKAMVSTLQRLKANAAEVFGPDGGSFIDRLSVGLTGISGGVDGLKSALYDEVSREAAKILRVTTVERREPALAGRVPTAETELGIFQAQATKAINGAALASGAVLALNVAAAAADAAIEVSTLGQVDLVQRLVTNIIWATGLADLGGLAMRAPIANSFGPLLERYVRNQAQAEIPGQGDLIRFLVREVFNPERRAVLRSDDDLRQLYPFMRQRGYPDFWTDSFWAAHWNLPSVTQLNEMVHRGVISVEEWERQVRFNDYVPEAIPWLDQIIYSPYTRVDVRRMADLSMLSSQELLQSYADIGYVAPKTNTIPARAQFASQVGEDFDANKHKAEGLFIFTRAFNARSDFRRRFGAGLASRSVLRTELLALDVSIVVVDQVLDAMLRGLDAEVAEEVKNLTTAQIVRGAKTGLISFAQGLFLLIELGWDSSRAEFLLRLQVDVAGPPIAATELGRRLTGGQV